MRNLKNNLVPFIFLLIVLFPFNFLEKGKLVLELNAARTSFLDVFFINASSLGNGFSILFVLFFVVLYFRFKWVSIFFLAFIFHLLWILLFKKGFYHGALRPLLYYRSLDQECLLNLIEGVKVRHVNTFPSGHTTCVFFLVSFFALLANNKYLSWFLAIIGLFVGVSRIYLIQHFFNDVYFGILFGTISSLLAYYIVLKYPKLWHQNKIQINFSIEKNEGESQTLNR